MSSQSYKEAIAAATKEILHQIPNAVVIGQGVGDPTRIFGTTAGLLEEFSSERIIDMPLMEEGMTGIAIGMALNGLYPIQTHIRVDFLLLAVNQLVNMAAKYRYMYGGAFEVPMLIRAVVGRSWGQGPQHSQSLQSLFAHIPGLTVIMPSTAEDAYHSYIYAAKIFKNPVLSIEHRFLYDLQFENRQEPHRIKNPFQSRLVEKGDDVTIVATSYMVQEAQRAAAWLKENTPVTCEIIDLHCVSQVDSILLLRSLQKTGHLIVADTSWQAYGVSAEICRLVAEHSPDVLRKPVVTMGMQPSPCPTSHMLEEVFYSDMIDIVSSVLKLNDLSITPPSKSYSKQLRKTFRGPF